MALYLTDHLERYDEAAIERLIHELPAWRREITLRIKHLSGRRESALAYLTLCRALRAEYGISESPTFSYGAHQKPFLTAHPEIHFSLSHCREAVGCLLSNHPCGFDIERIRTAKDRLVRHTMNEQEQEEIRNATNPDVAFTILWTRKEAVLKLLGTGITDNLPTTLTAPCMLNIKLETIVTPTYIYSTATSVNSTDTDKEQS